MFNIFKKKKTELYRDQQIVEPKFIGGSLTYSSPQAAKDS